MGDNRSAFNDSGRLGFVYVLTNRSMPGLVKIGCTRKHPLERLEELCAATGVPTKFDLAFYKDFADCFAAEDLAHEAFAAARVNESREFFAVSLHEVVTFLRGLVNSSHYRELASQGIEGGTWTEQANLPSTPFAELFVSFDPNGPAELTPEEQAKCRALERRLR